MKRTLDIKLALVALGLWGGASHAHAASVNGDTSASVMSPLVVTSQQLLNFGYVTPTSIDGTVTVTTQDTRIATGGALVSPGSFSRASFKIQGAPGSVYSIHTPNSQIFSSSEAGLHPTLVSSLVVNNFITYSVNKSAQSVLGQLSGTGEDNVYLGGMLTVPANAAPGIYSGLVPITVSY